MILLRPISWMMTSLTGGDWMVRIWKGGLEEVESEKVLEIFSEGGRLEVDGSMLCTETFEGGVCCIIPRNSISNNVSEWEIYNREWNYLISIWNCDTDELELIYKKSGKISEKAMKLLGKWICRNRVWGWIKDRMIAKYMYEFLGSLENVHIIRTELAERSY